MTSISESLERLGLNGNESKVLEALFSEGPLGASDIHRHSGVPRNKVYEILDGMSVKGLVEVQPGRPILFKASDPRYIVENLVENYRKAGDSVKDQLASFQASRYSESDPAAYAWVVRGRPSAKRKIAELVSSAERDIFMIGGFPNEYLNHVISGLKASLQRGLKTRAVSMVNPMESLRDDLTNRICVEYRTISLSKLSAKSDPYDMKLLDGFRTTAKNGCAVIIDETVVFNIVDEHPEPERVTGILMKAPGAPMIQKSTIERILSKYTRKL